MDFYFDEQLPSLVAEAINVIEKHYGVHNVYSTEHRFGKGVKDLTLYKKLSAVNGILITSDLKMLTRTAEFLAIKESGISIFFIDRPSGSNFTMLYRLLIDKWEEMKEIGTKGRKPFLCKIKQRGKPEYIK